MSRRRDYNYMTEGDHFCSDMHGHRPSVYTWPLSPLGAWPAAALLKRNHYYTVLHMRSEELRIVLRPIFL